MNKNSVFKLIFKNKQGKKVDLDYQLHDSILAQKWFKKIKHLKNIKIDNIESEKEDFSNLKKIYNDFCLFADIKPINYDRVDQELLNKFHKIFEDMHQILSKKPNNSALYRFHHCIHHHEPFRQKKDYFIIGWGIKEGPLQEYFNCNEYYEKRLIKNNIYLNYAELGKKPLQYWRNRETNNQKRINELCKPHMTLRANFFIPYNDLKPEKLDKKFIEWFNFYKNIWLAEYKIKNWSEIDEYSAPLLALALHSENIKGLEFDKIIT